MIKVKVTQKNNYNYTLKDEKNNKTYKANIEFINIVINEGDYIYISGAVRCGTNDNDAMIVKYDLGCEYIDQVEYTGSGIERFNKLLVDDSNIIRNFVQKVVPEEYSVVSANDGQEAINVISEDLANLKGILLDLNICRFKD